MKHTRDSVDSPPERFLSHTSTSSTLSSQEDSSRTHNKSSRPLSFFRSRPNLAAKTIHSSADDSSRVAASTTMISDSPTSPQRPALGPNKRDTTHRRNADDWRRYSGTVQHCGRHSNDWLFGGFSLRDTVRDGVDKLRHHHQAS
ncbi:hypothetical protein ASPZODRAFT_1932937 [Penicilliopsis zonata CBS 506.65]|uniref:Uncharacterized protein n=1 Tax=Penicilliopsis zonata CBS 506.65 TaxID=1073090 RepID=A0A1L9SJF9_9EURO|nr:hypothetical protein ASPZODRAFT_1932937 [Penicilliopsis zonata CBS 506.65]OJJ47266.1 hypothetical protein ASPZODRAFT_1932937 [Penicilliopsis zonata CBS 506.65]